MRIEEQPAFILHARAWRETSLLIEAFTREHGRVGLVARGVRGARSRFARASLQPLQPLLLGWSARGDGSGDAPLRGSWRAGGVVRHGFTHFDLELGLAIYAGDRWSELAGEGEWWPVAEIEEAGLPTLFAKAARLALS